MLIWTHHKGRNLGSCGVSTTTVSQNMNLLSPKNPVYTTLMGTHLPPALCQTFALKPFNIWSFSFHGWSSQGSGNYVTMTSSLYLKADGATISVVMITLCRKLSCFARSVENCKCWAIARTLLPPSCALPLAALLP